MSIIIGFDDYLSPAKQLAQSLSLSFQQVELHRFPDGETKVTIPTNLPKKIIICRTLNQPNPKLIELILTASAAREQGVEHITLVAPYLCYMRQDIAFNEGEAVSQKIIGKLIAEYFDRVITIDPHLHRIEHLSEAIPIEQAISLHATEAMSDFLKNKFESPVIIGPDEESFQWAQAIAKPRDWYYTIATKQRHSDTNVEVSFSNTDHSKQCSLTDRDIVIVDDIASTGKTLEQSVLQLQQHKPKSISIIVTHAFFVDDAIKSLNALGVNNIWSSDSVIHETNAFSIIDTIKAQLENK